MQRDLEALREALKHRVAEVAHALLGQHNPAMSSKRELRYGRKGSLAIHLIGDRTGLWHDFEAGDGGDLLGLIMRERRCDFVQALDWAASFVGDAGAPTTPVLNTRSQLKPVPEDREDRIATALKIWAETAPIAGTPAETYLRAARGIDPGEEAWPADLRFHPACPFKGPRVPAMVALLRDIHTGEPCGIHRTALKPDGSGKAGTDAKAMLGRARDAAIMLDAFDEVELGLAVCEGIESGLSARFDREFWLRPLWVLGSAGNIASFPVLSGIEAITVFADGDATGRKMARTLCARYEAAGLEFNLLEPESDGLDANDILRGAA